MFLCVILFFKKWIAFNRSWIGSVRGIFSFQLTLRTLFSTIAIQILAMPFLTLLFFGYLLPVHLPASGSLLGPSHFYAGHARCCCVPQVFLIVGSPPGLMVYCSPLLLHLSRCLALQSLSVHCGNWALFRTRIRVSYSCADDITLRYRMGLRIVYGVYSGR